MFATFRGMARSAVALALVSVVACAAPRSETPRPGTSYDVAVAGVRTADELAHQRPNETLYGWHLDVSGGRARYFVCTAIDACTFRRAEVAADALIATETVGRARPTREDGSGTGEEVDVVRLTIAHEVTTTRGGVGADARGLVVR